MSGDWLKVDSWQSSVGSNCKLPTAKLGYRPTTRDSGLIDRTVQIAGRTFLVTGGASGIGAATARKLATAGGNVVICDIGAEHRSKLAVELGARGLFATADVTDETQVAQAVGAARQRFGALHGAVSCAGITPGERVLRKGGPHRLDNFRRAVEINFVGTFNVLRLAAQAMERYAPDAEGERGVIINTASI